MGEFPPRFAFLYEDPLGEKVDTIAGTVTKWLGSGRDTTIALRLTDDELAAVFGKMSGIRYFEWPEDASVRWWDSGPSQLYSLPLGELEGRGEWVYLDARSDTTIKRVQWPWCMRFTDGSDEMSRVQQLVNLIWFEVAKHTEYRALPSAKYSTY